jgi:hypothetical protein
MTKAKRPAKKPSGTGDSGRYISRIKGGQLMHVQIARPRSGPEDVDLKAVRKALRAYFKTHPKALERS